MILLCLLDRSEWACGTVSTGGHLAEMDTHTSGKVTVPTTASNKASAWSLVTACLPLYALPVMPCDLPHPLSQSHLCWFIISNLHY